MTQPDSFEYAPPSTRIVVVPRPILGKLTPGAGVPLDIAEAAFADPVKLSLTAIGLYLRLLAEPVGTVFTLAQITDPGWAPDPAEDTAMAMGELLAAGYVAVTE